MSRRSIPAGTAEQSASGAREPVTLIHTPWVRLVSTDRFPTAMPNVYDRAA